MENDSWKKRQQTYEILRCYKDAIKNMQKKGVEPSPKFLARMAEFKSKINIYNNGDINSI